MLLILVTKQDFQSPYRSECQKCAIAQAINRSLPEGYYSSVGYDHVTIHKTDDETKSLYNIPLSEAVGACISLYDRNLGNLLDEFSFELPIHITEDNRVELDREENTQNEITSEGNG